MSTDDDRIEYLVRDGAGGRRDDALSADERADLDELRALLADASVWDEPSPALEDRIVAAIATEPRPGLPAPAPTERIATTTPITARRRPRLVWPVLAAAAAIILLFGIGFVLQRNHPGPQHFSAALAATDLAPGASGHVSMTKTDSGWRIELDATGLPRLDNGRYYQAWLKNAAGVLVPIGTFNEAKAVTLWAGVSPFDFPTLTITEEQADGDQASSGRRVLVGTVAPGG